MTTSTIDNSQRVAAKVAGISGLLAVVIVIFGNYALLGPLVVPGKAAETAQNFVAHSTQVRVALICFLTYGLSVVVLLAALYVIFRPVNRLLAASFDNYYVGLPFFALAATVCGYLWFKSGYIPRSLAVFGVVASAWCVICAFIFLVFPSFDKTVNAYWFDSAMAIFELILSVWLLTKGIRTPNPGEADHIARSARKSVSLRLPVFL